jgi:type II secretory pathway pseudopilin PulG
MENRSILSRLGTALRRLIAVILLMAFVTVGVWFYQQNKISSLNARVKTLESQITELKKSDSVSQSVNGEIQAMTSTARDTERQTDIKAMHGQIEAYYAQNGRYPTLSNVNDPDWRASNMKGLDESALKDPQGVKAILDPVPGNDVYAYAVLADDKSTCNNDTRNCAQYTLTATLENGQTYTKQNLN